jgi:hypothetical protein
MYWWLSSTPPGRVAEGSRKNYGETRYNMLAKVDGRIFHITVHGTRQGYLDNLRTQGKQTGATGYG